MTDMNTMHDHYTVVSNAGGVRISRVVIAANSGDAAETHRLHYPGGDIISIRQATASIGLTA